MNITIRAAWTRPGATIELAPHMELSTFWDGWSAKDEARLLHDTLRDSLPGGTLDELRRLLVISGEEDQAALRAPVSTWRFSSGEEDRA
jgi:hypothetical protein